MTSNTTLPIHEIALAPSVRAIFSKRGTDDHANPYAGFNICHYTGDDIHHIDECSSQLCSHLGINAEQLIIPRQTHSTNIAVIDSTPFDPDSLIDVDALVTNLKGVALAINTADCVPILLAEENAGVIAAAHSGWRGTFGNIAGKTVQKMVELGASPLRIKAYIGPSICWECFEVGNDVVLKFRQVFGYNRDILKFKHFKSHIDLQEACRQQLVKAGVVNNNITLSGICSHCNPKQYFTARTHGIKSGRTASIIIQE